MIRLDKFLAEMQVGTRSQVKQMIRKKQVAVDGEIISAPDMKVEPEKQEITVSGKIIRYAKYEYYMLHKPAGTVSATKDHKEKTVLDLLPKDSRRDLFPVGRLDKDTEGLLLITNDGDLAHRLLSPKKHVDKLYFAKINDTIDDADIQAFAEGLDIGDEKPTLPAQLRVLSNQEEAEVEITIQEGRFHQVKRMFEARGKKVVYLKRLAMGSLKLDESLKPGESRLLTDEEIERLITADVER